MSPISQIKNKEKNHPKWRDYDDAQKQKVFQKKFEKHSLSKFLQCHSASANSRRLSLGLPLRHPGQTSFESSDDDQKNPSGSPTSPIAAPVIPAAAGSSTR